MSGFRKLDERLIHRGHVIEVVNAIFEAPDGSRLERDVVRHPGAVSVVPVHEDLMVVMVRQFRAPIDREILEIPAGKRDVVGEPPEVTARRELAEEVGLVAGRLMPLMQMCHSPGFCDEVNHIFMATELTATERRVDGVEEAHMTIEHVALGEAIGLIRVGVITDAKSVAGLTLAAVALGVLRPEPA